MPYIDLSAEPYPPQPAAPVARNTLSVISSDTPSLRKWSAWAVVEPLLSGYLHPPQPEAFHHHHHQHTVLRLGQHTLQYDHRHGDRRPPRRELRDLLVRGRQPP